MAAVWHLRPARRPARGGPCGPTPTGSGFRHNLAKKLSPGPKNGLERRPARFSTICAKNQILKLYIDKSYSNSTTQMPLHVTGDPILYFIEELSTGVHHGMSTRHTKFSVLI